MILSRRRAVLALALVAAGRSSAGTAAGAAGPAGLLSAQDAEDVAQAAAYLQSLTTAEGRFVQTDARGGESRGEFYLQRPGRARFDYDPPSGVSIASDGHEVTKVDRRLKTIQSTPLGFTPLALFLARNIRLDRGVDVTRVERGAHALVVVARPRGKSGGAIALEFSRPPLALTGWTVTDTRGGRIRIRLEAFERAPPRPAGFFTLADPKPPPSDGPIQ
jgi:outer membrane lipoprotein-sorting protein